MLAAPRKLDEPRRELDEYFAGRRRRFEFALDWQLTRGFGRRVLEATAEIPYGAVLVRAGRRRRRAAPVAPAPPATRSAPTRCRSSFPCHRVLHADGGLGGYTGGLERKRTLLAVESGQAARRASGGAAGSNQARIYGHLASLAHHRFPCSIHVK